MKDQDSSECIHNDNSTVNSVSHLPIAYELEMHRIIQCEAFLLAESEGFKRSPLDYWLAAEKSFYQRL